MERMFAVVRSPVICLLALCALMARPAQARVELEVARSDSLSEQMEANTKTDNRKALRIGKKVAAGALVGGVSGLVGASIALDMEVQSRSAPEPGTDPSSSYALGNILATALGFCIGNMVGAPIGVSLVDPQNNFRITLGRSLAGSVMGLFGGIGVTAASKGTLWPSLFIGPVVMATAWSEKSRQPPQDRRVSFGVSPTFNGGLSAAATLRF